MIIAEVIVLSGVVGAAAGYVVFAAYRDWKERNR